MANPSESMKAIGLRIESLKANRNLFTVLFAIESAILTLSLNALTSTPRFAKLDMIFILPTIILLIVTLILMLLGIYSLTDSIHFYSKYTEFRYAWYPSVHERLKDKTPEGNSKKSLERALEADDIGYCYIKFSIVFFLWSLASFILTIETSDFYSRLGLFLGFLILGIVFTLAVVKTYQITHQKPFKDALKDFFKKKPVFAS